MAAIASNEVEFQFSAILERVKAGEEITITEQDVPIAVITPITELKKAEIQNAIKKLEQFQKQHSLGDVTIRELIEEGRRF